MIVQICGENLRGLKDPKGLKTLTFEVSKNLEGLYRPRPSFEASENLEGLIQKRFKPSRSQRPQGLEAPLFRPVVLEYGIVKFQFPGTEF